MDFFLIILLSIVLTIAVIEDLRRQKIPNIVTLPTMALAVGYNTISNGFDGLLFSAGGIAVGLGLFIVPYALGGMGAGDVKLMGAIGAIFGPLGIIISSFMVIFTGGVYGVILYALNPRHLLLFVQRLGATLTTFILTRQICPAPREVDEKPLVLRYAVPISFGAIGFALMKTTGYDLFPELLGDSFHILSINF